MNPQFDQHPTWELLPSTEEDVKSIDDNIVTFNKHSVPFTQKETPLFLNHVIKDSITGELIAGINACMYHWGILYIDVLFVSEKHRGHDLGSNLLNKVESDAKAMGGTLAHLDTFDFQAKDFYMKQKYELFGLLEDCPPGHNRYYLKKKLS